MSQLTSKNRANKLIEERVNKWNESDSELSLHEWLGWSEDEYKIWFETSEPPSRVTKLFEFLDLLSETRVREADVSDGTKVNWGHGKHIRDLRHRIEELGKWRDRCSRGSESRANYTRLIQKLKSELKSAEATAEKNKKKRSSK